MLDQTLVIVLILSAATLLVLAARRWAPDTSQPDSRPPGPLAVLMRQGNRLQLQRPAFLPAAMAVSAIVAAELVPSVFDPVADVSALQAMTSAYAGGMLTIFTLLAGLTAGFTFTVIGTMGSTFTPLLADPAIRAPRFWWFLAFSTAGMFASAWLLLMPPVATAELIVTLVCLIGSIITLTVYLRGVALDANPATLLRRLTDNDVPPAGFKTFARGRPVQIGLAVVRAALQRRDGPIAAAATCEVVRACAHFQEAMLKKPIEELGDPELTWGPEYIAEVQSEFRQWIDELDDNPAAPASAYDAAGRLLAYPIVWETTLHARLGLSDSHKANDAQEDLEQPLHALLIASASNADAADAPVALRRMTMKTAAFGGALNTIHASQVSLIETQVESLSQDVRRGVVADLAGTAVRLAKEHVAQLSRVKAADRYESRLIRTTQEPIARQLAAIVRLAGKDVANAFARTVGEVDPQGSEAIAVFASEVHDALSDRRGDPMTTEDDRAEDDQETEKSVA